MNTMVITHGAYLLIGIAATIWVTWTLQRRDGYGIPSDAAGHGIEFDPDALERFTVRRTSGPDVSRGDMVGATSHRASERGR